MYEVRNIEMAACVLIVIVVLFAGGNCPRISSVVSYVKSFISKNSLSIALIIQIVVLILCN